ncbi:ogr/Delta-like zinc finger family protein [Lysobacter sp. TAB13]|uniref:ogr/Delta-like zinc finger family protein n=1 Tax=Lysobacter sp. TAB13 TaxID=3233065 RepID=UPI003F9842EA
MACPHCAGLATVQSSKSITRIYREATLQCRNPSCSFSWIAGIEAPRDRVLPHFTVQHGLATPPPSADAARHPAAIPTKRWPRSLPA